MAPPNVDEIAARVDVVIYLAWTLFLVLAGLSAFVLFVASLKRWPIICCFSVAVNVLIAWELPYPPALANIGGTSVYFVDVLSVAALAIVMTRFSSLLSNLRSAFWPWIGLGLLLFISLIAGLTEGDFGKAVNEFRSFFHPYALMTWAMSLDWRQASTERFTEGLVVALGWLLTGVAGFHVSKYGLGSTSEFVDAGTGLEQTTRPLVSGQALMLLLCAVLCFWYWRRKRRKAWLVSAIVFVLVVVVSQQRTVWAVAVASVIVVFIAARTGTKAIIALFGIIMAWGIVVLLSAQFIPHVVAELSGAATDSGTYDARVRSWTGLIRQTIEQGPTSVIFGQPMGTGFGRFEGVGRWVEFAPHNWYVTLYLRVGLFGLGMMIVFLLAVAIGLMRRRANMAALAVVVAVIVYGWSYSWPWYVAVFFGWAVVGHQTHKKSSEAPVPIRIGSMDSSFLSREKRL